MGSGIRAEVKIDPDGTCPTVAAARAAESPTHSISRSVNPTDPDRVTEEFMLETDSAPETDVELSKIFDYGSRQVFRFTRDLGSGCPCECVGQFDTPVVDVHTRDGMLYMVFHAADMEELQNIITALQETYPTVDVRRLLRTQHDRPDHHLTFVDRGQLTERQREVLETAHEMGYFAHPKEANAGEVASELEITTSTFTEHLSVAQSKLLDAILDG